MQSNKRELVLFFALTFVLSWVLWVPAMTASWGLPGFSIPAVGLIGAIMPGIAALLVAAITTGRAGVRALLAQIKVWRVGAGWYALAVLLRPAMIVAVFAAFSLWRGEALPSNEFSIGMLVALLLIQTPNTLLEEVGWRGYALPRMASTGNWLSASLILGVIWGAWHLPYWASSPDIHSFGPGAIVLWFAMVVVGSPIFAWLYRSTGSVLLAWLLHLTTNTAVAFIPLSSASMGSLWPLAVDILLLALVALVAVRSLARADRSTDPASVAAWPARRLNYDQAHRGTNIPR